LNKEASVKLITLTILLFLFTGCSDDINILQKVSADGIFKEKSQELVLSEPKKVVQNDGATIFRACASCHGHNAKNTALGKSQVINGWSAERVSAALVGYQNGTYGGEFKAIMHGQVSKLSAEDIRLVSRHIASF